MFVNIYIYRLGTYNIIYNLDRQLFFNTINIIGTNARVFIIYSVFTTTNMHR